MTQSAHLSIRKTTKEEKNLLSPGYLFFSILRDESVKPLLRQEIIQSNLIQTRMAFNSSQWLIRLHFL